MTAPAPGVNAARPAGVSDAAPILGFESVSKYYRGLAALDQVSLALTRGTALGLVGESGSGKSTCVRLALGLERPSSGQLTFDGSPYPRSRRQLRPLRRQIGFVLQDPYDSLDSRMQLRDIVSEPLRVHRLRRVATGRSDSGASASGDSDTGASDTGGSDNDQRVTEMLRAVGLGSAPLDSYPARYSGGGRQRIAIARALMTDPAVLLCDEPTSSLDVSVQAQIVNLLLEAKRSRDLSLLFVSHDLDLIGRVADTLAVMYRGRVMESGPAELVRSRPRHPYTKSLHDAVPADRRARGRRASEPGPVAEAGAPALARYSSAGAAAPARADSCVFADRCPAAQARCHAERPPTVTDADGRSYACFFPLAG
jgi:oligopeptide/dipeptide ABC transporter ATP-binding protein